MKTKRIMSALLAGIMCLGMAMSAAAAETFAVPGVGDVTFGATTPGTGDGDAAQKVDNKTTGGNQTVDIFGQVKATTVSAEITLTSYFSIDPNQATEADMFKSPTMKIKNTSNAPITITAKSIAGVSTDAPDVVYAADRDWASLGKTDTESEIQLGIKEDGVATKWFKDTSNTPSGTTDAEKSEFQIAKLEAKGNADSKDAKDFALDAKFGRAWSKALNAKYEMTVELALAD